MAVSNSGMTLYSDNDNESGWGGTDDPDDYNNAIQGTNSESWQVSKNSTETATLTKAANMGTSKYFTFYMSSNLAPYYTDVKLNVRTGTSNYEQWTIATSTDKKVSGDFHPIVAQFGQGTETGTLDKTDIQDIQIIVNNSSSGNIRSVINNWIDTMWYGAGRTIGGTTASDTLFMESHVLDTTTNDSYDGCSELYKGALTYQTDVTITTTSGNSYGETVIFAAGYNTNDTYTIDVTGTADFKASNYLGGDSGVTINLDTSGATAFEMAGGSLVALGTTVFTTGQDVKGAVFTNRTSLAHSGSNFENNVINTSGIMTVISSGTFVNNTFNEPSGVTGINATDLDDLDDCTFVSDGTGHAVTLTSEIATDTTMSWKCTDSDYASSDGSTGNETLKVNVASGQTLTISVVTGASTPTYYNIGSGDVDVVVGQVTTLITVKDSKTRQVVVGARVYLQTGASGTPTSIIYDMSTYNSTAGTTVIFNEITDSNGQVSDTRSFSSDTVVSGRVRMSTSSPFYKTVPINETIDSDTGLTLNIAMIADE